MLRDLTSSGFDAARKGVVLSGRAERREVTVVVDRDAIESSFPKIGSALQCVAFVERNLVPFRDMANAKLRAGQSVTVPKSHDRPHGDLLVELTATDLLRSRRWMTP
ncbi:MAG: hypothetical protein ABI399_11165 [Bauldia sp.]